MAINGSLTLPEDGRGRGAVHATDSKHRRLTYQIVSSGKKGWVYLDGNSGQFLYLPKRNANGEDRFTFRARAGNQWSNVATVSVLITPVNDPPTAWGPCVRVLRRGQTSGKVQAVDPDGDPLTFSVAKAPKFGTVTLTDERRLHVCRRQQPQSRRLHDQGVGSGRCVHARPGSRAATVVALPRNPVVFVFAFVFVNDECWRAIVLVALQTRHTERIRTRTRKRRGALPARKRRLTKRSTSARERRPGAFASAPRVEDPKDSRIAGPQGDTGAEAFVEGVEPDTGRRVEDLTQIHEEQGSEEVFDRPLVLDDDAEGIGRPEAVVVIAAEHSAPGLVRAADRRLQIERHRVAISGI